ncbi:MAG: acyltransferase [Bacteroidetes bacterium]|nr:acyltransferase [Bacteroidota bacterium]
MKNIFRIEIDTNRVLGLDILRALAIFFVVLGHGGHLLSEKWQRLNSYFIFDGVSIFFVLSGFLVGGLLIKQLEQKEFNKRALFNFWTRRWFRTLPNYFLILVVLCLLNFFFTPNFSIKSTFKYFIFSQNFFEPHPSNFFPEAWSLSVEEWFYLLLPICIGTFSIVFKVTHKKGVLTTIILVIILTTTVRYYRYSTGVIDGIKDWDLLFRKQVITRLDSLMFGVIGAYIQYYHLPLWLKHKHKLLLLGIFLFVLSRYLLPNITSINGLYSTVFSFSLIAIATLLILPYLSDLKTNKSVLYKPITYLSLISYSMYLLNLSILQHWILNKIPWNYLTTNNNITMAINYSLYWSVLILLSILLYKYFELPITKLRDRIKLQKQY